MNPFFETLATTCVSSSHRNVRNYCKHQNEVRFLILVYLRTTPAVCLERMHNRGRSEESTVDINYLEELHKAHEDWLRSPSFYGRPPVMVVDADGTVDDIVKTTAQNFESFHLGTW
jgi:deoxyadenosine/deoxycytidine kinase